PPGHIPFLMIDEARQIAVDFTRLPELLNQISARSEVATSTEDDKLANLETNRSPQVVSETSCLPRAAARSISFEPHGRRSTRMLRRRRDPRSIRTIFLIAIAVAVLPVGYLFFGDSDPPVNVAVAPQATANIPPVESLPLATTGIPSFEFLPLRE